MDNIDTTVGKVVRERRESLGWSQGHLVERLTRAGWEARQNTVSRIEHGEQPVRASELVVLASVLGVEVETLLGGTDRRAAARVWDDIERRTYELRAAAERMTKALGELDNFTDASLEGLPAADVERVRAVHAFGVPEVATAYERARLIEGEQ